MTSRCPVPGQPLSPGDQAEVDRFAAFLTDSDTDRAAAYVRHYGGSHWDGGTECTCAMTEHTQRTCPLHGESQYAAPDDARA